MHVDLNLLIALDALLEENSVAAAADRLHLSPPAMSRTLSRIRRATGDDILVRSGRTMTPTPRALELREETRELVRRGAAVLTPPRTLDLNTLDRVFTVRRHDALACALAPLLTAAIAVAPGVQVRLLAEPSADVADLARGHTDVEISTAGPTRPEIAAETVGADQMVAIVRAGHPLADGELTRERLAAAVHIETVSRRGRLHGVIDEALAERGLSRRVVAALPTSSAALKPGRLHRSRDHGRRAGLPPGLDPARPGRAPAPVPGSAGAGDRHLAPPQRQRPRPCLAPRPGPAGARRHPRRRPAR